MRISSQSPSTDIRDADSLSCEFGEPFENRAPVQRTALVRRGSNTSIVFDGWKEAAFPERSRLTEKREFGPDASIHRATDRSTPSGTLRQSNPRKIGAIRYYSRLIVIAFFLYPESYLARHNT